MTNHIIGHQDSTQSTMNHKLVTIAACSIIILCLIAFFITKQVQVCRKHHSCTFKAKLTLKMCNQMALLGNWRFLRFQFHGQKQNILYDGCYLLIHLCMFVKANWGLQVKPMVLKLILSLPHQQVPLFLLKLVNLYLEMPYLPSIQLSIKGVLDNIWWLLELTNILLHYFVTSFSVSL